MAVLDISKYYFYKKTKIRGYCPLFFKNIYLYILFCIAGVFYHFSIEAAQIIIKIRSEVTLYKNSENTLLTNDHSLNQIFNNYDVSKIETVFRPEIQGRHPEFKQILKIYVEQDQLSEVLNSLKMESQIEWAEPNHVFHLHEFPNDSLYSNQWALRHIEVPRAWEIEKGNPQIIVGVIDTGIDYFHQDLVDQLWINTPEDINDNRRFDPGDLNFLDDDQNGYIDDVIGWDFTDAPAFPDNGDYLQPDNDPMDEYPGGHGTPVAGIIGAATNNKQGIAGIAPNIRLMVLRAGTAAGFLEEDDVAEAILYALDNGCRIVNMSFGDAAFSHLIKDAVEYAVKQGILVVVSAGNSGNDILQYPAAYDETIAVGASDVNKNIAPFSSYGSKLNIVAPGQDILSTSTSNTYGTYSGTSFSAPMVSGVLALMWSKNPEASSHLIKSHLLVGCTDLGTEGWDNLFGHGMVNAYESLMQKEHIVAAITNPPTLSGTEYDSVVITGTAAGSEMRSYTLSYGIGKNPIQVIPFYEGYVKIINDTLGFWKTAALEDTIYTIDLKVADWNLNSQTDRVIIHLDRTVPHIKEFNVSQMVLDNYNGYFIEMVTDDWTIAKLNYRKLGNPFFQGSLLSGYFGTNHYFLMTEKEQTQSIEYYIELKNTANLVTIDNNNDQYFQLDMNFPGEMSQNFIKQRESTGIGYLLDRVCDFNNDGLLDVIGNLKLADYPESRISSINFTSDSFHIRQGPFPAFGRDILDIDGDDRPELLAGYGGTSYIFKGTSLPEFLDEPIESPEKDFWAARLYDFEKDGTIEILAIHQNQWHLYQLENLDHFQVRQLQTLVNPSDGSNTYGVPYAEISDLNDDGKLNIIIGDYEGDIIIYERQTDGQIIPVSHKRLSGEDATHRFGIGDFDGDGQHEIIITTQKIAEYMGESSQGKQYWIVNIFKLNETNEIKLLWEKYFYGIVNEKGTYSGISVADYDGDGKDEFFFSPYPRLYYLQFDNDQFKIDWYTTGVNSNVIPLIEKDRILFSGDDHLMVWTRELESTRPLPPSQFWVESADSTSIKMAWSPIPNAYLYLINRVNILTNIHTIFKSQQNIYIDTLVQEDQIYRYSVQTIDSSFQVPESSESFPIEVKAVNPPSFDSWQVSGTDQIILQFSKNLGHDSYQVDKFYILPDSIKPLSVIRGRDATQVLLSFLNDIIPGSHELLLIHLYNQYNVPFYQDTFRVSFNVSYHQEQPYLEHVEMLSKELLLLTFNHPMERTSVENIHNYHLAPDDHIIKAALDSLNQTVVRLYLTGQNRMGSLGVDYYLEFSELRDIWGQSVMDDLGNRHLIKILVNNLDNIRVYPNPLKPDFPETKVMFGNLPFGSEIFIYTINGKNVVKLANEGYSGGIWWDLRNEYNDSVQNGIYIYVAVYKDQKKSGKFVIMR
jgi:subtilisin family serine protease